MSFWSAFQRHLSLSVSDDLMSRVVALYSMLRHCVQPLKVKAEGSLTATPTNQQGEAGLQ